MQLRTNQTIALVVIPLALFLFRCSDTENSNIFGALGLQTPPVISGIHVTAMNDYDGTRGIVMGNPTYPTRKNNAEAISVVPNPFFTTQVLPDNTQGYQLGGDYVVFWNLPAEETIIEIYRGIAEGEKYNTNELRNGSIIHKTTAPFRIFKKSDIPMFFEWKLTSRDGTYVPSGLYRAYFSTKADGLIGWVDVYVLNSVDCSNWIDPTGWLSPSWNLVSYGKTTIDLCVDMLIRF